MTKAVILQARTGSVRLPGKVLKPLFGSPLIERVVDALLVAETVDFVVGAISENSEPELERVLLAKGCYVFRGSEEDVLGRFVQALQINRVDLVIRATGDNPFVSPEHIDSIVKLHLAEQADLSHWLGLPLGCGVEVVNAKALLEADAEAVDPYEREHVTPFLYRHRERFKILEPVLTGYPDISLTVDSPADFKKAEQIMQGLYVGKPLQVDEICQFFDKSPELFG